MKLGKLVLADGTQFDGVGFGKITSVAGEVVFSTGMVGYPEAMTDPSFAGQILIFTYPLIGNYGVPNASHWESDRIRPTAIIVSNYNETPSHNDSVMSLSEWLEEQDVPGLIIKDTRFLAKKLREQGAMLGKIIFEKDIPFHDPNLDNLVAQVSTKTVKMLGKGKKTIALLDGGLKNNIVNNLVKRNVAVAVLPWDFDVFNKKLVEEHLGKDVKFDGVFITNGPGDPKMADKTIDTIKKALDVKIPTFGICLGNQLLALAAGGDTYKLKFGHRSQNQPCIQVGTNRCYLTTQNHGFAVGDIPKGFKPWFVNANDNTNEGIIHDKLPFFSVQFHPESTPGPLDTDWLFDFFVEKL